MIPLIGGRDPQGSLLIYMQIRNVRILRPLGINGIVIYPFIFYADKNPAIEVIIHESIHWQQIRRDGVFRFYKNYLQEYLASRWRGLSHHQSYMRISYEREAYAHQRNPDYLIAGMT